MAQHNFIGAVDDAWQMFRLVLRSFKLKPKLLRRFFKAKTKDADAHLNHLSDNPADYEIGAPIGFGATSIVYGCRYFPNRAARDAGAKEVDENETEERTRRGKGNDKNNEGMPCAIKVVDLDLLPPASLRLLRRETQLMSLSKHPNVLRVRGSWMAGHKLYIALRLMNAGSAADVMRYGWPGGMEEEVVKCILKQALEGLK